MKNNPPSVLPREIKFRIWHAVKQIMLEGSIQYWFKAVSESGRDPFQSGIEIMQYTGLKDENGREIYEGDIVKNKTCTENVFNKAEIFFEDGKFQAKASGCNMCDEYLSNGLFNVFEIIGNIYENPELLSQPEGGK